jgi:hypothetical protein
MPTLYPTGKPVPFNTVPLLNTSDGAYATGLTIIKLKMRRASDDMVLDWGAVGGPTFINAAGPFVQLLQPLVEFGAAFPGEYLFVFDPAVVLNITPYDTYYVTVVEDGTGSLVSNLPQVGQFRVAEAQDDATDARKALYNDQDLQPGDTNNLVLKDDDGITDYAKWNVKDPNALSITIGTGAPAIRERTL